MKRVFTLGLCGMALTCWSLSALAQLTTTRTDFAPLTSSFAKDGAISANEYGDLNAHLYTGGGGGFGGTVGGGSLYMDFDASNLNIGFQFGNSLNDFAVIFFDTKAGGFTDATMDDTSDGGRRVISNLTRDSNDVFPFEADYALVFSQFGVTSFELTSGELGFQNHDSTFLSTDPTQAREVSIAKSDFAIGSSVDFFVAYASESNYMSDEGIPGQAFSGNGNIEFGGSGDVVWSRYNRLQAVPSPGALSVFALGGLPVVGALLRRRRK